MIVRRQRTGHGSRRSITVLVVVIVAALSVPVLVGSATASTVDASAATVTWTATRDYIDGGVQTQINSNKVTMTVSRTANLKSLQQIQVNWSGAMPTAGTWPDPNSDSAMGEEHSFVLLECRGTPSTVTPQTCWTQYADERFDYSGSDAFPAWRSDEYAAPAERAATVGAPSDATLAPTDCPALLGTAIEQRWVPYTSASGTEYPGGVFGCAGEAPEAVPANSGSANIPSNETFGVTDSDGTGSANFDVFTAEDHASLGCSQTVACSLVALPIEGISCDVSGSLSQGNDDPAAADALAIAGQFEDPGSTAIAARAKANCETNGTFAAGTQLPQGRSGSAAVSGQFWWSASNWRNRMAVALTFALPDDACSLSNQSNAIDIYGSEIMTTATIAWSPHFCLDSNLFNFHHIALPEPQARGQLSSADNGVHGVLTTDAPPGGYPSPVVSAPVSVAGFGIAYLADTSTGKEATTLKLDARLLAKLLTESYPDSPSVQQVWTQTDAAGNVLSTALRTNPISILQDPEFEALNPGLVTNSSAQSSLLSLNTSSDEIYALTSYINADPEARAWLDGTPDPWGMQVNPNYKAISLPVSSWPILDSFILPDPGHTNICMSFNGGTPYLPLIATPVSRLAFIALDVEFGLSQVQSGCSFTTDPTNPGTVTSVKFTAAGRQAVGQRFMLGLVSLGDAARDGLNLASLESVATTALPTDKIVDGSGRTFVAPTTDSMAAATKFFTADTADNIWTMDYTSMRSAAGAGAYPGTMPVYAAIPTSGLSSTEAAEWANFLDYADGAGQVAGEDIGQLPEGYLPMTTGNGLGAFVAFTARAAAAVAAQQGTVPAIGGGNVATASSGTAGVSVDQTSAGVAPVSVPPANTGDDDRHHADSVRDIYDLAVANSVRVAVSVAVQSDRKTSRPDHAEGGRRVCVCAATSLADPRSHRGGGERCRPAEVAPARRMTTPGLAAPSWLLVPWREARRVVGKSGTS